MGTALKNADVAIVGGGAAGCLAAISAKDTSPKANVVILEKASLRRGRVHRLRAGLPRKSNRGSFALFAFLTATAVVASHKFILASAAVLRPAPGSEVESFSLFLRRDAMVAGSNSGVFGADRIKRKMNGAL